MAVFRGGCTLDAAERVADADLDTLQSLVDKSLLRHADQRFWMLETIREYAWERLAASGEEAELRRAHALFALDFAEATGREIDEGGDQTELYARMAGEYDNLRTALEWARDADEDEVLLRLTAAVGIHWRMKGLLQREARGWLALALERASSPPKARMDVLLMLSAVALWQERDYAQADLLAAEWLSIAERTGDESGVLRALNTMALTALERRDFDEARTRFVAIRETAEKIGDPGTVAVATVNLSSVGLKSGEFQAALDDATEAVGLFRELGDDGGVAVALGNCGWSALRLSDPVSAEGFFREGSSSLGGWEEPALSPTMYPGSPRP